MSAPAQILVLSSCTGLKSPRADEHAVRAEDLYTGQQHIRLMRGVRAYRTAGQPAGPLRLRIVSAGSGLLAASTKLRAYEQTFQGLPRSEIRKRANDLGLPGRVRSLLRQPRALSIVLLGDDYLTAIGLEEHVRLGAPTIAFCGPRVARELPDIDGLIRVPVGAQEARRYSCGLVSLKGELAGRALMALAAAPSLIDAMRSPAFSWLEWLDHELPTNHALVERPHAHAAAVA
jgi:hypothetical protein